jgi:release factor glutamine methyltransferase
MVAANLPYVRSGDFPKLQPEVRQEPREALDGGRDGLSVISAMLDQLPGKLRARGAALMECDPRQIKRLTERVRSLFPNASIKVLQDLARRDRVVEMLL